MVYFEAGLKDHLSVIVVMMITDNQDEKKVFTKNCFRGK